MKFVNYKINFEVCMVVKNEEPKLYKNTIELVLMKDFETYKSILIKIFY